MPQIIGDFELHETLGSGLQGKVKRATHVATGAVAAIKLIDAATLQASARKRQNVTREVSAMGKIAHENVVRLEQVVWNTQYTKKNGTKKEVVAIVLELARGGELFDFLMHTGAFNEQIAQTYFKQLLSGLQACHTAGVAHRDLKPENLLLDESFRLKITDFGLSVLYDELVPAAQMLRTECGTKGYMAPEILARQPYDGFAADVWSAGVVLFIMLAGFPPFQLARNGDWWFDRIKEGRHELFWQAHERNVDFSAGAKALLNRIFQADPARRASVAELLLDGWVTGGGMAQEVLEADLRRRKMEVDGVKAAEALARRQAREAREQVAAAARDARRDNEAEFDPMSVDVHRSVAAEPCYRSVAVPAAAPADGEDAKEALSPTGPGAVAPATPPLLQRSERMERYTRFHSDAAGAELLSRVSQAFSAMCAKQTVHEARFKAKAEVQTQTGPVKLAVKVYTTEDGLRLVEAERRGGSVIRFHEVWNKIVGECADICVAAPAAVAAASAAAAADGGLAEGVAELSVGDDKK